MTDPRERAKAVKYEAQRIIAQPCCFAQCLKSVSREVAMSVVTGCLNEVEKVSTEEKAVLIFDKIRNSVKEVTTGGYIKINYNLGVGLNSKLFGVCHTCFENVYGVPERSLGRIRQDIRMGMKSAATDQPYSDKTSYTGIQCKAFIAALVKACYGTFYYGLNIFDNYF